MLLPAGAQIDTALAGMTGVTGWILPALFIAFLAVTRRLPVRNPPDRPDRPDSDQRVSQPVSVAGASAAPVVTMDTPAAV